MATLRAFNMQHADDAVAGKQVLAGAIGTFDPNLAKNNPRVTLAKQSRRKGGALQKRMRRRHGRGNKFHFGAVNGHFSTDALIACAVIAAGLWYALKK